MRGFQTAGHLHGDFHGFAFRHTAGLFDILFQRNAFDQFHDDIVHAVLIADIVNADDIRVRKTACRLRLPAELCHKAGIGTVFFLQHLNGYGTLQHVVPRTVNVSHTAGSDGIQDLISVI